MYNVEVDPAVSILPHQIEEALPEKFSFQGVSIDVAGAIECTDTGCVLVAGGSGQKYTLADSEGSVKKLVDSGSKTLRIHGALTQGEPDEKGVRPLPEIAVESAQAVEEKKK